MRLRWCDAGHKSRYAYAAWTKHGGLAGAFAGVVKLDLAAKSGDAEIARIEHGAECWGGEAVFVPRHDSAGAPEMTPSLPLTRAPTSSCRQQLC